MAAAGTPVNPRFRWVMASRSMDDGFSGCGAGTPSLLVDVV
jgi:hypothetical protein